MSRAQQQDLACPQCGLHQKITFWSSINVTIDPDLRRQHFEGEINVFRCVSGGAAANLSGALMYHDMRREFCVWFYPFGSIRDPRTLDNFTVDGKFDMKIPEIMALQTPAYMQHPPVVFHQRELLRYIEFREALHAHHHPDPPPLPTGSRG